VKIERITPINWDSAIDRLSAGAYFLLSVMYYKDIEVDDKTLMQCTKNGLSSHRKYKRELLDDCYITSKQVGKGIYMYEIGDNVNG